MRLYKLTDENNQTYNECQWGEGIEHTADGKGILCTHHWLHAYSDPRIAVIMNAIHSDFENPILWEATGDVGIEDGDLKVGCTRLKTLGIIPLPNISMEQKVKFAIYCAKQIYSEKKWDKWASSWLSEEDRSLEKAELAVKLATWFVGAAQSAARSAARAAQSAAQAARAAVRSEELAESEQASWAAKSVAGWAARSTEWATQSVRWEEKTHMRFYPNQRFDIFKALQDAGI